MPKFALRSLELKPTKSPVGSLSMTTVLSAGKGAPNNFPLARLSEEVDRIQISLSPGVLSKRPSGRVLNEPGRNEKKV